MGNVTHTFCFFNSYHSYHLFCVFFEPGVVGQAYFPCLTEVTQRPRTCVSEQVLREIADFHGPEEPGFKPTSVTLPGLGATIDP